MDRSFDLSAICWHSVTCLKVCGAEYFLYGAVLVLYYLVAFYDICAHKSDLAVGLESEEFWGRNFRKVGFIYIDLTGEGKRSCSCIFSLRIVGNIKIFLFVLGIVCDNELDRLLNSYSSLCLCVELFSYAVLEHLDVDKAVGFCNACVSDKRENR